MRVLTQMISSALVFLLSVSVTKATPLPSLQQRQTPTNAAPSPQTTESTTIPTDDDDLFVATQHPAEHTALIFKDFFLVTTTSTNCSTNSSQLANVSALSLFAPLHTATPLLRQIGPGYMSLPKFNLTASGTLTTWAPDGFGKGNYLYGNQAIMAEDSFTFAQGANIHGGGGIGVAGAKLGYTSSSTCLVEVNGVGDGWTVCPGPLGQQVVQYQTEDAGCTKVYLQLVKQAPY